MIILLDHGNEVDSRGKARRRDEIHGRRTRPSSYGAASVSSEKYVSFCFIKAYKFFWFFFFFKFWKIGFLFFSLQHKLLDVFSIYELDSVNSFCNCESDFWRLCENFKLKVLKISILLCFLDYSVFCFLHLL